MKRHDPTYIPQPIADGWQVRCSCGRWRSFASFYEFDTKDDLLAELKRQHDAHVAEAR